jgi:tetratricopeptide (TPR) repeat protein
MCQELRYEDPKRMVDAGFLAVYTADRLSPRRYGIQRVADLRCRARIELGNAYRVADWLDDAERLLGEAVEIFQAGSRDELLQARLCDVRASLLADRRCFEEAGEVLDTVFGIYERRGDRHLAGRALISKGIYVGYGGAPEEAIRLLREGLSLIKVERDPALVYAAVHNQAHFLLTSGRLREARALLLKVPATPEAVGGRVNLLKISWLAAQIDAELGDCQRAEQALLEVKRGFEDAGLYYKAALVSLERVNVLIRQERQDEARDLVVEALGVFKVLRISREVLGGLLLLDQAFEEQAVTAAVVEGVLEMLKRAENDPAMRHPFAKGAASGSLGAALRA